MRHTIPHRANEQRTGPFDRAVYRQRNVVERLIARCKQFRGLATRYEKLADSYRTLWVIVGIILWLEEAVCIRTLAHLGASPKAVSTFPGQVVVALAD